mmetsp:Transcript_59765/g.177845  ORF Transcript_59765/g.177845 Transcript_59765/m.177845 type:complete len:280 (+) Transcript_59765:1045-1884(+)
MDIWVSICHHSGVFDLDLRFFFSGSLAGACAPLTTTGVEMTWEARPSAISLAAPAGGCSWQPLLWSMEKGTLFQTLASDSKVAITTRCCSSIFDTYTGKCFFCDPDHQRSFALSVTQDGKGLLLSSGSTERMPSRDDLVPSRAFRSCCWRLMDCSSSRCPRTSRSFSRRSRSRRSRSRSRRSRSARSRSWRSRSTRSRSRRSSSSRRSRSRFSRRSRSRRSRSARSSSMRASSSCSSCSARRRRSRASLASRSRASSSARSRASRSRSSRSRASHSRSS